MARTSRKRAVLEDQGLLLVRPSARATLVAGIDEAGRGCFAGPVVAGAVSQIRQALGEQTQGQSFTMGGMS